MTLKHLTGLLIIIFSFNHINLYADNSDSLSINIKNKPLKELLAEIEKQTDFTFVYSNSEIDVKQTISYNIINQSLINILNDFFPAYNIQFQIIDKHIVLQKPEQGLLYQHPQKVSGIVKTKIDSFPMPGVNVFIEGTPIGTITREDGTFELSIPEDYENLTFSFIGYKNEEIKIANNKNIQVFLSEETKEIKEVVVVGYGLENSILVSSSVSNIKADFINISLTPDVPASLKGKLPGIYINQNSGTPGGANTLRIRGISSITAGADPLYIIDGVPLFSRDFSQIYYNGQSVNSLTDIATIDIESITILKDASATAIYGARGSNGVVLITTKRGYNNSDPTLQFNSKYGVQQVVKTYDLLDAEQFMRYKNEAAINDGGVPIYSESEINDNNINTNWQDELYQITPIQNYNLSFSGGSQKTNYYLTTSYFHQEGIVQGTDYSRINARVNLDHQYSEKLKIGTSLAIIKSENNRKEGDQSLNGPVPNAIALPPTFPVYNEDGSYNDDGPLANPISIANQHINTVYNWRNIGNMYSDYKLTKNLAYKFKVGIDYINFREHTYDPPTTRQGAKYNGLGIETTSEALKTLVSNILNFNKSFNNIHHINILTGYEIEKEKVSSTFMRGTSFASEDLEYLINAVEKVSADAFVEEFAMNSFLGRIKYNLNNKYLGTINARVDGSSKLSKKNRYGFFPSGDIAWRISEEDFFYFNYITSLKIRASYGITGNDKIPNFLYISRFGTSEYANASAIYPINIANPDLKWETTRQMNLGLDLSLFRNRIQLTADYYKKKTDDLLLEKPIPVSSGFENITANIGKIENTGFEIALKTINIDKKLFWESHLNISSNQNKVTQLHNNQPIENIGRGYQRIEVGEPIGIFYGYNSLGVDPSTGDIVFEDINNDGIIDINDRKKIGDPHPDFYGGFLNSLSYLNLNLEIFLQFSYGNDVFNGTRRYIESMKGIDNQTTDILNRWQKPGDVTDIPRATNADPNENNRVSSRFIEDGSYLKIKSIKLSYNFNNKLAHKLNLSEFNLFIMGQNLYTFTNYSGMDPEVNYAGANIIRTGVEFFTYPPAKIYSAGLTLKF
ncbi:MAG: SusC/RagA family TonB-linked outer membrane protein [Thiohalospira sp.]